jgi:hypothetical protein
MIEILLGIDGDLDVAMLPALELVERRDTGRLLHYFPMFIKT